MSGGRAWVTRERTGEKSLPRRVPHWEPQVPLLESLLVPREVVGDVRGYVGGVHVGSCMSHTT